MGRRSPGVADALGALSRIETPPTPQVRPWRRATPELEAEIVRLLSAAKRPVAHIALALGVSLSTVNRVRQRNLASWAHGPMLHAAAE